MMSNSVTLEQLNAPTDQELGSLRCTAPKSVYVYMEWNGGNGLGDWAEGYADDSWVRQRALELRVQRAAANAPHEDEELMLRIPLDEGV
jgi:hypothetical protein